MRAENEPVKDPRNRLPDFIIIGMMKSGTSSLYYWLAEQPECSPAAKEINFFSEDALWARGVEWYSTFFAEARPGTLVGEASTSYTKDAGPQAARRMAATVPDARLICVLRHPLERTRSEYRHHVRRGREKEPLVDALRREGNSYIGLSMYFQRLKPYIEAFPREQLCVVRLEDLSSGGAPGWAAVLAHLGLDARPAPSKAHNVTAEQPHFTPLMLRIWSSRYRDRLSKLASKPLRRVGRAALLRSGPRYDSRLDGSKVSIPAEISAAIWEDVERLETWMGVDRPLWDRNERTSSKTDEPASS